MINIFSTSLRIALGLSAADRRWIDFLTQTVVDTWDHSNPSRPKNLGFLGSEEFIRLQFEEYLLALLASVKYHLYIQTPNHKPSPNVEGDPSTDFNNEWIHAWQQTSNFNLFNRITDSHIFDVVEPRHPTAGNLTIDDVQRRLTQQIQTLHLDERFATSKDTLNKHLATGQKKVSTAFANLWADIEAMREAQRKRQAEQQTSTHDTSDASAKPQEPSQLSTSSLDGKSPASRGPDLSTAQASVQVAGQKAGAYFQSWGTWAAEKKKDWSKKPLDADENDSPVSKKSPDDASAGKLSRWSSISSNVSFGRRTGAVKEEKGADGIGRLDAG